MTAYNKNYEHNTKTAKYRIDSLQIYILWCSLEHQAQVTQSQEPGR